MRKVVGVVTAVNGSFRIAGQEVPGLRQDAHGVVWNDLPETLQKVSGLPASGARAAVAAGPVRPRPGEQDRVPTGSDQGRAALGEQNGGGYAARAGRRQPRR